MFLRGIFTAMAWIVVGGVGLDADAQAPRSAKPSGPLTVEMRQDAGLPGFTVYQPMRAAGDAKLAVLVWGNGACRNAGNLYSGFLSEVASHGYLVVSLGPIDPAIQSPRPAPRPVTADTPPAPTGPRPDMGPQETRPEQILQAIDWAVGENVRPGGALFGGVDTKAIGVMGHSCGGVQALWAALKDSRVRTVIVGNSGAREPALQGIDVRPADLERISVPVLYLIGGPTDVAYPVADNDLEHLKAPVFRGDLQVGHGGTYNAPNGGDYAPVSIAWLDWRLKANATAARMFSGADCGLCRDPKWTVIRKNLP